MDWRYGDRREERLVPKAGTVSVGKIHPRENGCKSACQGLHGKGEACKANIKCCLFWKAVRERGDPTVPNEPRLSLCSCENVCMLQKLS